MISLFLVKQGAQTNVEIGRQLKYFNGDQEYEQIPKPNQGNEIAQPLPA